jgi:hypothetical protein
VFISYRARSDRFTIIHGVKSEQKHDTPLEIVEKPIVFDAQRKFLTVAYREKHTSDCDYKEKGIEACVSIIPKLIVVHMTDIDNLQGSFDAMYEPVLGEEREKLISRSYDRLNVSAHYLIDKDGTIYRLMPETYMSRHAIGVNHNSISIENVGLNNAVPSPEQVESSAKLVQYLLVKYNIPKENVYSHAGTAKLRQAQDPLFVELDPDYFEQKRCGERILTELKGSVGR